MPGPQVLGVFLPLFKEGIQATIRWLILRGPLLLRASAILALGGCIWTGLLLHRDVSAAEELMYQALGTKMEDINQPNAGLQAALLAEFDQGLDTFLNQARVRQDFVKIHERLLRDLQSAEVPQANIVLKPGESGPITDRYFSESSAGEAGFLFLPALLMRGSDVLRPNSSSTFSDSDLLNGLKQDKSLTWDIEHTRTAGTDICVLNSAVIFDPPTSFETGTTWVNNTPVQSYIITSSGVLRICEVYQKSQEEYYAPRFKATTFFPERTYFISTVESTRTLSSGQPLEQAFYVRRPYIDLGGNGIVISLCKEISLRRPSDSALCMDFPIAENSPSGPTSSTGDLLYPQLDVTPARHRSTWEAIIFGISSVLFITSVTLAPIRDQNFCNISPVSNTTRTESREKLLFSPRYAPTKAPFVGRTKGFGLQQKGLEEGGRVMSKRTLPCILVCIALACTIAEAQNLCPPGVASDKLICLIPQVFGVNGLVLGNRIPLGHFQDNFLSSSLRPLNSAIARQSIFLPLASPSSGITFSWDPEAKVFTPSTDSFGPILGERADTIGEYRVFIGFDYQYFQFSTIDGLGLKSLPLVFSQQDDSVDAQLVGEPPGTICSVNGTNTGGCGFIRDIIKTDNRVDLKIHQFTTFMTFGLTNRIDLSLAIPVENVRMSILSNATIVNNSQSFVHIFPARPGCGSVGPPFVPCLNNSFSNFRSVSGIGDMTLRVKGSAWKGERAALALGVDVRVPTGDQMNFLGAGAAGVKPFVVWSYRSRISPHAFVGYETNGSSVIAGDISTGQKTRLPSQLTYSGGADVWVTKWLTAAFDLTGQQVFEARRTLLGTFTALGACTDSNCQTFAPPNTDTTLDQTTATFNITNASFGYKIRPFSNLLVTGNVLIKINDGGLRAKAIPLAGLSYTF